MDAQTEKLQSLRAILWLIWPAARTQDLLIASGRAPSALWEWFHVVVSVALHRSRIPGASASVPVGIVSRTGARVPTPPAWRCAVCSILAKAFLFELSLFPRACVTSAAAAASLTVGVRHKDAP